MFYNTDGSLKILCVGNSFSHDAMAHAFTVATDLGFKSIKLCNLFIGGCTIKTHAINANTNAPAYLLEQTTDGSWEYTQDATMESALISDKWDFVTLQQASGDSGLKGSFELLDYLVSYVKARVPETTRLAWHMTWAYQQNSTHAHFPNYGNSQTAMYRSIVQTVKDTVMKNPALTELIPTGTAIQNARTSSLGDALTRDGYHLSLGAGRFIAALSLIHSLTGADIANKTFSALGVSQKEKEIAVECVLNATSFPLDVTPSDL